MSRQQDNGEIIIAAVVIGIPLLGIWSFANWLGAGFKETLVAVLSSAVVIGLAGVAISFLQTRVRLTAAVTGAVLWPMWWPVLDSMATHGCTPSPFFDALQDVPWWDTMLAKGLVEMIPIGLAIWAWQVYRRW